MALYEKGSVMKGMRTWWTAVFAASVVAVAYGWVASRQAGRHAGEDA